MDTIFLRAIRCEAMIGIYRRERTSTQPIEISLEIALPNASVFNSGKVADTIDYAVVDERVRKLLAAERYGLVEQLAEALAQLVLKAFGAPWVRVSVAKLGILRDVERVGVTIERSRAPAASADPVRTRFASGSDPFSDANNAP